MMRVLFHAISFAAVLVLSVAAGHAQAPAAAAPKSSTPPNPARLPDGHPNWTGFWTPVGGLLEPGRGAGGTAGANANTNTPLAVRDIPALKSPYKEQYAALMEQAKKGPIPDPVALCYPQGMPRMMGMIYGMELLQTPNVIAITGEFGATTRRIWMDVKKHPPADELDDSYAGHSIGRWEGDTLVIDTVGIRDDVPMDQSGLRHSKRFHISERFTQTSPGILVDEITMDDPEAFERPWKQTRTLRYRPELRLMEFVCLENNRNIDGSGLQTFK